VLATGWKVIVTAGEQPGCAVEETDAVDDADGVGAAEEVDRALTLLTGLGAVLLATVVVGVPHPARASATTPMPSRATRERRTVIFQTPVADLPSLWTLSETAIPGAGLVTVRLAESDHHGGRPDGR